MGGCPFAIFYSCTILLWRKRLLLAGVLAQLDRLEHPREETKRNSGRSWSTTLMSSDNNLPDEQLS